MATIRIQPKQTGQGPAQPRRGQWARRHGASGFTMIEIAIALAIIGFALVAIIGILPMGLNVQKETREKTIINQDAGFIMNALKSGSRDLDELTNYVERIDDIDWFTDPFTTNQNYFGSEFFTGEEIVGILTRSNGMAVAYMRTINGPAVDSASASRDLALRYQLQVIMVPAAVGSVRLDHPHRGELGSRLKEIRLEFSWPVFPSGRVGNNRLVYRGMVAGDLFKTNNVLGIPLNFVER